MPCPSPTFLQRSRVSQRTQEARLPWLPACRPLIDRCVNITWLDPCDTRGIIVCIHSGPIETVHVFPLFYAHHLCLQTSFPWSHVGHAWNPPFRISCRDSLMLVTFSTFLVLKMCLFGPRSWKAFSLGIFFQVMEVAFHGLLVFFPAGQVNRQRYSPESNLSPSLAAFQICLTFEHHGG